MIPKEYKSVLLFLAKFLGLYLVLNISYGLFIEYYQPGSDPFTRFVTSNVVDILSVFDPGVTTHESPEVYHISVLNDSKVVIRVFEGCNSLNVMIVFVSFLFAFKGPLKLTLKYLAIGLAAIYVMNLARVLLLYEVSLHYPKSLYFFHKYFFTAILYGVVFVLWYIWIKKITRLESRATGSKS